MLIDLYRIASIYQKKKYRKLSNRSVKAHLYLLIGAKRRDWGVIPRSFCRCLPFLAPRPRPAEYRIWARAAWMPCRLGELGVHQQKWEKTH